MTYWCKFCPWCSPKEIGLKIVYHRRKHSTAVMGLISLGKKQFSIILWTKNPPTRKRFLEYCFIFVIFGRTHWSVSSKITFLVKEYLFTFPTSNKRMMDFIRHLLTSIPASGLLDRSLVYKILNYFFNFTCSQVRRSWIAQLGAVLE